MFSTYLVHLKSTLADANPKTNKLIWQLSLIYGVLIFSINFGAKNLDISNIIEFIIGLLSLVLPLIAFAIYYHLIGQAVENKKQNIELNISEFFRDTDIIFVRSTVFLLINWLILQLVDYIIFMFSFITYANIRIGHDFISRSLWQYKYIFIFYFLWVIFPAWFIKSMPINYSYKQRGVVDKRILRQSLFLMGVSLFIFLTLKSILLKTIHGYVNPYPNHSQFISEIFLTLNSIILVLVLVVTFTVAARMSKLTTLSDDNS